MVTLLCVVLSLSGDLLPVLSIPCAKMLLKVSYILLGYMLVDGFFLRTYGENVTINFDIKRKADGSCAVSSGKDFKTIDKLTVQQGDRVVLNFKSGFFMNDITCNNTNSSNKRNVFFHHNNTQVYSTFGDQQSHTIDSIDNRTYTGQWYCQVLTLEDSINIPKPHKTVLNNVPYMTNRCFLNVTVVPPVMSDSAFPSLYIYVSVGVIVAIIIIAQTAVILYLKVKAKKLNRLDSLTRRTPERNDTDKKRYSKPPGVKASKFSRMLRKNTNKDDETIYETLEELKSAGEQTPPVPPIENIPTIKKKQSLSTESPEVMSKSLPRPEKKRQIPPLPATLHRIPERGRSPDLDISKRPPLPLPVPVEMPEDDERSASPSRLQRTPLPPLDNSGLSNTNTVTRPIPGTKQASVTSELDNVFKMRKAASELEHSSEDRKFIPEPLHPLPTGKSAILLGLTPGPPPKPKPKTNAVQPPPKPPAPKPQPNPFIPPLKPIPTNHKPVTINTPSKSVGSKPPVGSIMLPKPSVPSMLKTSANSKPIAAVIPKQVAPVKPGFAGTPVKLPGPPGAPVKLPGATGPSVKFPGPHNLRSVKQIATDAQFEKPAPQIQKPFKGKPPTLPPAEAPVQDAAYEESGEPFYNDEEWEAQDPHPPRFEKPTKPILPAPSIGKPPPLPPPNKPIQEDVYEEYADTEPMYNSDDEWTYEPLEKYNIYSS